MQVFHVFHQFYNSFYSVCFQFDFLALLESVVLVQGKVTWWNNLVLVGWGAYLSSIDISQDINFHSFNNMILQFL